MTNTIINGNNITMAINEIRKSTNLFKNIEYIFLLGFNGLQLDLRPNYDNAEYSFKISFQIFCLLNLEEIKSLILWLSSVSKFFDDT